MQSLLGTNHCLPLSHMAKIYIYIEETIIQFLIGYMINPTLNNKEAFKLQVTKYMKTKFGAITQQHISNIVF